MPTDTKHLQRLQLLDQCFSDPHTEYTFEDLMLRCNISRATLFRELQTIVQNFGSDVFTNQKRGKKRIYRYRLAGFSIVPNEVTTTQLAQIKSVMLMLNKFVGKPQFEYLQSIIRELESRYHIELPNTEAFIHFDGNIYVKGLEHLVPLFDAVINKQCVQITYQPFDGSKRVFIAHPYLLKEYNHRWFLFAAAESDGKLLCFALDRIDDVTSQPSHKYIPFDGDLEEYFDDIIGVTNYTDEPVQHIVFWVSDVSKDYVKTKPIHGSQREIKGERLAALQERYAALGEGSFIELSCIVNYELEQLLMSFMDKIVVLSPESLVKGIAERVQNLASSYKTIKIVR